MRIKILSKIDLISTFTSSYHETRLHETISKQGLYLRELHIKNGLTSYILK